VFEVFLNLLDQLDHVPPLAAIRPNDRNPLTDLVYIDFSGYLAALNLMFHHVNLHCYLAHAHTLEFFPKFLAILAYIS
jgi:hypothetical protein